MGASEASASGGELVHDSHAEVVAKRAFQRYLIEALRNPKTRSSLFDLDPVSRLYSPRKGVRFHFFSTHAPCGDATIYEITDAEEPESKRPRVDQNRTGAKCLTGQSQVLRCLRIVGGQVYEYFFQDLKLPGASYHTSLGAVRTKPGRGDPTRSLSCSDKLLKWRVLGLQGSVLSSLFSKPITYSSFTTVCPTSESKQALERYRKYTAVVTLFNFNHLGH